MKSGLDGQKAFNFAVQKIGRAKALKTEFKKIGIPMETQFVKLMGTACGVVAGLFSLWILLVLLTVHEAHWTERLLGLAAVTAIIFSWLHGGRFLPTIHHQRVRSVIGLSCCLASVGGMMLFIKSIMPRYLELAAGAELPVGRMLVSFMWAWAAMAILGGVGYGLEKAARKSIAT